MSASAPRFLKLTDDNGNHVATRDTQTGTEYAHVPLAKAVNHEAAVKAAAHLDTLGGGWQLAGYHDATSIINLTRHDPAVDPDAFPWIKSDWYWLREPAAWSSASAWSVSFDGGYVSYDHRGLSGFALAVRRAGQ